MVLLERGRYFCATSQRCPEHQQEMPSRGRSSLPPTLPDVDCALNALPLPTVQGMSRPEIYFHNALHAVKPYASDHKEGKEAFRVERNRIVATRPMNDQSLGAELETAVARARRLAARCDSEAPWVH
jgi:hypothetical protein